MTGADAATKLVVHSAVGREGIGAHAGTSGTGSAVARRQTTAADEAPRRAASFWVQFAILFQVFWLLADGQIFDFPGIRDVREGFVFENLLTVLSGVALYVSGTWESGVGGLLAYLLDPELGVPVPALLLFYVIPTAVAAWRREWTALVFGMAVAHASVLAFVLVWLGLGAIPWLIDIGAKISFLWVLVRGRLWSRAYLAVLVLTAIQFGTPGVLFDWSFSEAVFPVITSHLTFVLTVLAIRALYFLVVDNIHIVRSLGFRNTVRMLLRTALLWTPILLFAAPYFIAANRIDAAIEETAYRQDYMRDIDPRTELEADTLASVTVFFQEKIDAWNAEFAARSKEIRALKPERFSDAVREQYDRVLDREIYLQRPEYDGVWGGLKSFGADVSASMIEETYRRVNDNARRRVILKAEEREDELLRTQGDVVQAMEDVRIEGETALIEARENALASIRTGFFIGRTFDRFTFLLFMILCIKSFFYVFARVACARDTDAHVTLGDPEDAVEMPRGEVTAPGNRVTMPEEEGAAFFFARRFQPHGKAPKFAIPQRGSAPVARIRHGCYAMNRFVSDPERGPIHITATRGAEFVVWSLEEGESIVFDYRYFVGMAETVTLGALISARITTQIFGRFIFPTATGPGRIIFLTEGAPQIAASGSRTFSMPPSRLVAWHRTARFHIDSEMSLADVYFSEAYVEPVEMAALIMDVDRQDRFGRGLTRFLRHFLLPM